MIRFRIASLVLALSCTTVYAADYHLIICGSGGEEPYTQQFQDWGKRLHDVLIDTCGVEPENVTFFTENGEEGAVLCTLENINSAFESLAEVDDEEMRLTVYLIGHGSYRRQVSKLMIPGPDLSAEGLDAHLGAIAPAECNILVTASSGAGFINVLSAPDRLLISATKSVEQRNATDYTEHLIAALEEGGADTNRDDRISFLEACTQAAELTKAAYADQHLLATETTILDDNGDGLGSRLPLAPNTSDGKLASIRFLKEYAYPEGTTQEEIDTYSAALTAVREYKEKKDGLDEETYYTQLEKLLIQAARANRAIRAKAEPDSESTASASDDTSS